jgi:hypothetical protein
MYKFLLLLNCILLTSSCSEDENQAIQTDSLQRGYFINVVEIKEVSGVDIELPRKFSLATFIDNKVKINCWEQSLAELDESELHCNFEDINGSITSDSFKQNGIRYVPAGFVKSGSVLKLIVTVINKDAFLCYDSAKQHFFCLDTNKYSQLTSFSIDSDSGVIIEQDDFLNHELFYGAYMQPYVSNEYFIIPFWGMDNKATQINEASLGYLQIENGLTVTYFDNEQLLDYVEPSFTVLNDIFYMSFRSLSGEYVYFSKSYNRGETWTPIEASSVFSPSSINKIFTLNDKLIGIIHNNYKTSTQANRNTLDITYVDEDFNIIETINLLSDEDDYFSNFGFHLSKNLTITIQELDRARETGPALDRVVTLTITE